jgi:transaldolase
MIYLDSSDPKEIEYFSSWGIISGVTTNPLIISREAKNVDLETRVREILTVSPGDVSVELVSETEESMLEEAIKYVGWASEIAHSNICIKVPFNEIGIKVIRRLDERGVPTNATCIMSMNQAYLAALAGAVYVSIFSGRVKDMGYDVKQVISGARGLIDAESLASKIIVGSIRQVSDVNEALESGAHIVTVPPKILRQMTRNPKTDETIREFNTAWANRGKS